MKVEVKMDSVGAILRRRGLGPNGRVQKICTSECARQMDPYVPMRQGTLKNTRTVGSNYVEYKGPYAHYQYIGKLMVGITTGSSFAKSGEPKVYASPSKDLRYNGAPRRGPLWDKRMWSDKGRQITLKIAKAAGGKPG